MIANRQHNIHGRGGVLIFFSLYLSPL
jgi:hypothetical protein